MASVRMYRNTPFNTNNTSEGTIRLTKTQPMASESLDPEGLVPLSALELQVLSQYQALATNLNALSDEIARLNQQIPAPRPGQAADGSAFALLENMRELERKIGLVYTLFRTAVYSLLLQNEDRRERRESQGQQDPSSGQPKQLSSDDDLERG